MVSGSLEAATLVARIEVIQSDRQLAGRIKGRILGPIAGGFANVCLRPCCEHYRCVWRPRGWWWGASMTLDLEDGEVGTDLLERPGDAGQGMRGNGGRAEDRPGPEFVVGASRRPHWPTQLRDERQHLPDLDGVVHGVRAAATSASRDMFVRRRWKPREAWTVWGRLCALGRSLCHPGPLLASAGPRWPLLAPPAVRSSRPRQPSRRSWRRQQSGRGGA